MTRAVGLALSGGGIRAMAFHLGMLRWLAETGRLEHVRHISTVSGGTLAAGLVLAINNWKWPDSKRYLDYVALQLRDRLTQCNLGMAAISLLLRPRNWHYALSRATVLAEAIERCWNITGNLAQLPRDPIWSLNATTAETGRRFRFKNDQCGDYELGYADAASFSIAGAMATSAAFPGLIGPVLLRTSDYTWKRRPYWNAPEGSEAIVSMPYDALHLYDGGVYDNLALEPLVDAGNGKFKKGIDYLVCSDAGAPLPRISPGARLNPLRLKRVLDISMDQTRSLRIRSLVSMLKANPNSGAYAQIGADPVQRIEEYAHHRADVAERLRREKWLKQDEVRLAACHPTTLFPLSVEQFTRLEQHGYESIRWNEALLGDPAVNQQVVAP